MTRICVARLSKDDWYEDHGGVRSRFFAPIFVVVVAYSCHVKWGSEWLRERPSRPVLFFFKCINYDMASLLNKIKKEVKREEFLS